MESLRAYIDQPDRGQKWFAEQVGVSPGLVSHWLTGRKKLTAEKAKAIEVATGGVVMRHELRPDLFDAPQQAA